MHDELVILIVDSKDVFDLMKPALSKTLNTTRFVHCPTHETAMQYVHSDRRADIIFADWLLADFSFINEVRSDLENHNTPIIIMSEEVINKKIILNEAEHRLTYFLTKPFLDKGLVKKVKKVLKQQERRRSIRLHPHKNYFINIASKENGNIRSELMDVSESACLLRLPIELSRQISIYEQCIVDIQIDEFQIEISAELIRIGSDRSIPEDRSHVLIMMKFINVSSDHINRIGIMLDELYLRW